MVSPVRRGQRLAGIPFVFHGPGGDAVAVGKMPLADIMAVNLDHYRLDADYKHVSAGLTSVLRWVYWWHSSVENQADVSDELVLCELNTDVRGGALEGRNLLAVEAEEVGVW